MKNPLNRSYYRNRIVLTFLFVTIILVSVLARVSYVMVKELYLNQISANVSKTIQISSEQINKTYLGFLESGITTTSTKKYFQNFLTNSPYLKYYSEVFIFNNISKVIVHSDSNKKTNVTEPRLFLNQNEIFNLDINSSTTSLPFKGNDNNWYLWGFYKLSQNHWLALKESAVNFEKVESLSTIIWYFGIGGILVSFFLSIIVSNSITKPIRKLVSFSEKIGKGPSKVNPPKNMKGELKVLSNALDKMRINISNNQKEKEKILAQIAHEIRNPLGGIELLTNLLNESNPDLEKKDEYTTRILNEVSELKRLISSYLDYSKPTKPNVETVNIDEIFSECCLVFDSDLRTNNIKLVADVQLKQINFDRTHLKNVIINLIKNSIESIGRNGEIKFTTFTRQKKTCVAIYDNGVGINSDQIENIFNPFYTTKPEGTGLGLATSKKYCEDNFAELNVEQLQNGCQFTICKENEND